MIREGLTMSKREYDKYVHFGHSYFDRGRFEHPKDVKGSIMMNKPYGGLWASPCKKNCYTWLDWCKSEDFCLDKYTSESRFTFRLTDDARVFHIRTPEDAYYLADNYPLGHKMHHMVILEIDYAKVVDDYDAVQIHIYDEEGSYKLYSVMYGWDCDSIVVLNPEVIIPIKENRDND